MSNAGGGTILVYLEQFQESFKLISILSLYLHYWATLYLSAVLSISLSILFKYTFLFFLYSFISFKYYIFYSFTTRLASPGRDRQAQACFQPPRRETKPKPKPSTTTTPCTETQAAKPKPKSKINRKPNHHAVNPSPSRSRQPSPRCALKPKRQNPENPTTTRWTQAVNHHHAVH